MKYVNRTEHVYTYASVHCTYTSACACITLSILYTYVYAPSKDRNRRKIHHGFCARARHIIIIIIYYGILTHAHTHSVHDGRITYEELVCVCSPTLNVMALMDGIVARKTVCVSRTVNVIFFFVAVLPKNRHPQSAVGGGRKGEEGSARGRRDRAQANRVYGKPNPENGFGPALDSGADASAGATDRPG